MNKDDETVMHMPRIVTSGDGGGPMGGHAAVRSVQPPTEIAARLAEIDAVRLWASPEDAQRAIDWLRTQLDAMRERAEKADEEREVIAADRTLAEAAADDAERERDEARSSLAALVEAASGALRDVNGVTWAGRAEVDHAALLSLRATLASLAPTAKARDERLLAAMRTERDEERALREAIAAESRERGEALAAERARADAAEARLALLVEKSRALYREAYGPSRAITEVTALCDALGAGLASVDADVAAWTERVRQEGREQAQARFPLQRWDFVKVAQRLGVKDADIVHFHDLPGVVAQALDRELTTAERTGYARGVSESKATVLARIGLTPFDATSHIAKAALVAAARDVGALSPHPAAPCPNANLIGWTDLPCEHCGKGHGPASRSPHPAAPSPAQPMHDDVPLAGTYACPICGDATPHGHDERELPLWRVARDVRERCLQETGYDGRLYSRRLERDAVHSRIREMNDSWAKRAPSPAQPVAVGGVEAEAERLLVAVLAELPPLHRSARDDEWAGARGVLDSALAEHGKVRR